MESVHLFLNCMKMKNKAKKKICDLISLILEGISKINEDEEEDDWGVCQKACECLQSLSLILKNDIISQVGVFFKNQIE